MDPQSFRQTSGTVNRGKREVLENLSPVSWVPSGIFALLALYFLDKAVRPKARRTWGWGRTMKAAPVSRPGYAVLAITFLNVAALLARSPKPPLALVVLFFFCFLALGIAGFLDTRAFRRSRTGSSHQDNA